MTTQERSFLTNLSKPAGANDIDSQIAFLKALIDEGDRKYDDELFEAAKTDITAYSELIDDEWFPSKHHQLMLEKLKAIIDGDITRCAISCPVGHGKSVYSSQVATSYALGLNPMERIIVAGHTQSFVETTISKKVRSIVSSERYKKLFPDTILSSDSKSAEYFSFVPSRGTQPGFMLSKGAGGGLAGFRSNLVVVDDIYPTQDRANSKTYRDMVYTWWNSDLMTRLLPHARVICVMTRWHTDDLLGHILEDSRSGKGEHWEEVILPAICEDPENDPLGRQYGEPLWGEFHTLPRLMEIKKTIPAQTWNALYQCAPTVEGGNLVKQEWFQYWDKLPEDKFIKRRFISVDTANTANQRSDFSVATAWIQDTSNRYYLVDVMRKRLEYAALISELESFARINKADAILLEQAGVGATIVQAMQGKFCAPLIGIKTNAKSKGFRLDSITPLIESGSVLFPRRHELLAEVERELLEFPQGKHDDLCDAISQALNWARGSNIRRGVKKLTGGY